MLLLALIKGKSLNSQLSSLTNPIFFLDLKLGICNLIDENQTQQQNTVYLPRQCIWNKTSATKFTAVLESNDILSKLQLFENTTFNTLNDKEIDQATVQFTNIMDEEAKCIVDELE